MRGTPRGTPVEHVRTRVRIHAVVNFLGRFPDQEKATSDEDQIPPGKAVVEQLEHRGGQLNDDGDGAQQRQPQDERQPYPDAARAAALILRQLVREDRDEDEVVDPEHHLHGDERGKGGPGGRVDEEADDGVHPNGELRERCGGNLGSGNEPVIPLRCASAHDWRGRPEAQPVLRLAVFQSG